jgi:putative DNA primase/helicase
MSAKKSPDLNELGAQFVEKGTLKPYAEPVADALSDLGNAERFVRRHGSRVRYCAALGTWLVWDGKRWAPDRDGSVCRLAAETVRAIYGEAGETAEKSEREKLAGHAVRSEAQPRLKAMLELAKSIRPIATVPEAFDGPATNFLLNVENGTLDLTTGTLRPHRADDCMTRMAPVQYVPGARSALWDSFLEKQVPDPDVRAFLARAAGYTLTGDTREEVVLFVQGPGGSGKSTFAQALNETFGAGEYAMTCPFETFLRQRGGHGVRDDIARLAGARMVLSLEVDEGRAFDAAALKNLTGGDKVAARPLYGRYFEFRPAFKLWLVANDRPRASAQDSGLWRRVLLVPFTTTVPEKQRDRALKAILTGDPQVRQAILAWAVAGCLEWQRIGLQPPDAVRVATAAYRVENDSVRRYLAETFDPPPPWEKASEMQSKYTSWCETNGEKRLPGNRLGEILHHHGLTNGKDRGVRGWRFPAEPQWTAGTAETAESITSTLRTPHEEVTKTAVRGVPPSKPLDVSGHAAHDPVADRARREKEILEEFGGAPN